MCTFEIVLSRYAAFHRDLSPSGSGTSHTHAHEHTDKTKHEITAKLAHWTDVTSREGLLVLRLKHFRGEKIAMYGLNATVSLENIVKQVFKLRDIAFGGWLTFNNLAA